jgi:hypothetical protein
MNVTMVTLSDIDIFLQAVAEIILSKHFSTKPIKPVSMHLNYRISVALVNEIVLRDFIIIIIVVVVFVITIICLYLASLNQKFSLRYTFVVIHLLCPSFRGENGCFRHM